MSQSSYLRLALAAILSALLITTSHAQQKYVSDELVITVRSGQSTAHQVLNTLKSGDRVEVLSSNSETGYSYIRQKNGKEGWALSQYLTATPTAAVLLKSSQKQLSENVLHQKSLKEESIQLAKAAARSNKHITDLEKEMHELKRELSRIRNMAGHAPALSDENLHLKADLIRMETELQTYEQENMLLRDRSARDWFIAGTGVALIGFIMGLLIHRIKNQKKSSWSEL